jgi:hypothetical protein
MAIDHRVGSKVVKHLRREDAAATRVDPHPYIGIVKNNLDPTRAGRLQVWVPDLGGDPDAPSNWRTVSYASPFMGTTDIASKYANKPNSDNKFVNVPHTYGMWMVPPDIGVEVIVIFIAGDPLRGYFIACVNSHVSRHMMPGLASSNKIDTSGASADTKKSYQNGITAPVAEYNENDLTARSNPNFIDNPKPIHEQQYSILKTQGLDRDTARGTITSSSQRESPSNVFGISTPGRPYADDPANNREAYLAKQKAGTLTEDDYRFSTRVGGHTFVMDDGAVTGENQLVRLRTAGGHQIMMNDTATDNTLYISHSDGTSWVELTKDGAVNIYTNNGFNVRSEGSINLHSDNNINLNAANKINMKSGSKFQIDCGSFNMLSTGVVTVGANGTIGLQSDSPVNIDAASISMKAAGDIAHTGELIKQNSGGAQSVNKPKEIQINNLSDVVLNSTVGLYTSTGSLSSIVTVAPTHEPYRRSAPLPFAAAESIGQQPAETYTGKTDATKTAAGIGVKNPATEVDLRNQPTTDCSIGGLTSAQMTAYYAVIGKSESGSPGRGGQANGESGYRCINSIGFVGKYQFGYPALQDAKHVKMSCGSNAQLRNPNNWIGKDGIDSLEKFLNSPAIQEAEMCAYTKRNYKTLCNIGTVTKDTPLEDVAGLLAVSHLLGAGGAKQWRGGSGKTDAFGTTGDNYFAKGKYAVAVLGPKMATLDQPIKST